MELFYDNVDQRSFQWVKGILEPDVMLWSFCSDPHTLQFRYLSPEGFGQSCAQVYTSSVDLCSPESASTCSELFGGTTKYPLVPYNTGLGFSPSPEEDHRNQDHPTRIPNNRPFSTLLPTLYGYIEGHHLKLAAIDITSKDMDCTSALAVQSRIANIVTCGALTTTSRILVAFAYSQWRPP